MNNQDLLEIIGEAQSNYLVSAIRTKGASAGRRSIGFPRKLLIAAAVVSLLTMTAFAVEYVGNLFETYFREGGNRDLTPGQVEYIEENTQSAIAAAKVQTDGDYQVSVRSALTDGKVAYITVDIQAPEGTPLEGGQIRFYENPMLIPDQTEGLILAPDGSSPDAMCDYTTIDDGDGRSNTASIMFKVNPLRNQDSLNPFDGSIRWTMKAGGFYRSVFDSETMDFSEENLGEGSWEFTMNFQKIDTREVNFLSKPISVMTSYWPGDEFVNENQILKLTLSGLSYRLELANPEIGGELQNIGDTAIVMKDGSKQTLLRLTAQVGSLPIPIVLDQVDHILLADGTKLYPPA